MRVAAWPPPDETDPAASIEAWIDDEPAGVLSVAGPEDPLILIVVMDVVGDLNRIDRARETLAGRIREMEPFWHVALMQAQDGARVLEDPTRDRGRVIEKLLSAPISGYPGLLDAVEPVARIADRTASSADVRVAVLYITDGAISQYRGDYTTPVVNPSDRRDLSRRFGGGVIQEKFASLSASLGALAPPQFFLHLEERQNEQDFSYQTGIRQLAEVTGGQAVFVRGVADVAPAVESLLDRIQDSYSLTLAPPPGLDGPARLRLESKDGGKWAHREALTFVKGSKSKKKKRKGR